MHVKHEEKMVSHESQKTSFHKEKQEIFFTDSGDKAGHGGERRGKMLQKTWEERAPKSVLPG